MGHIITFGGPAAIVADHRRMLSQPHWPSLLYPRGSYQSGTQPRGLQWDLRSGNGTFGGRSAWSYHGGPVGTTCVAGT